MALSSEAEYVALATAATEASWLKKLDQDFGWALKDPITIVKIINHAYIY